MKKKLLYFIFTSSVFLNLKSQTSGECLSGGCTLSNVQYPTNTQSTTSSNFVTIANDMYAGEFAVCNVTSGNTYEWSTCPTDGGSSSYDSQLTLLHGSTNSILCFSDDNCSTNAKISWVANFTGTVKAQLNSYNAGNCMTNSVSTTVVWRMVSGSGSSGTNQTGLDYVWAKQYSPSSSSAYNLRTYTDNIGNVYTHNQYYSTIDIDPSAGTVNLTGSGNYIVKYSSMGAYISHIIFPADNYKSFVDQSGNIYIAGTCYTSFDADPSAAINNISVNETFLAKYNSSGNLAYIKSWGVHTGTAFINIVDIFVSSTTGEIGIAGGFSGTIDFDPNSGVSNSTASNTNGFFLKLNSTGVFQWKSIITSTTQVDCNGITIDNSGNYLVSGWFQTTGNIDLNSGTGTNFATGQGPAQAFLVKYSSSGSYIWGFAVGGSGADVFGRIKTDSNDNIYVEGNLTVGSFADVDPSASTSNVNYTGGPTPGAKYYVKYSSAGLFLNKYDFQGFQIHDFDLDSNDDLYIKGDIVFSTSSPYSNMNTSFDLDFGSGIVSLPLSNNETSGFIAKYSQNGSLIWAYKTFNISSGSLNIDNTDNCYLSGTFSNTQDFDFNANTVNLSASNSNGDLYLGKYQPCTSSCQSIIGINEFVGNSFKIKLYPTVNSGSFKIESFDLELKNCKTEIIDRYGKKIREDKMNEDGVFNCTELSSGLYFLKIYENQQIITTKFIIQK